MTPARAPIGRIAWIALGAVTALRLAIAAALPMTGDEAYYWEWSKRLAWGYVDHPPAVAALIRAFSAFGTTPFAVRAGFVLCGVAAAVALGLAVAERGGDRRAVDAAVVFAALAPIATYAFATASPDGPYLACWSLALLFAARTFARGGAANAALLGFACGGALLARIFSLALVGGIIVASLAPETRRRWRREMPLAVAIAASCFAPFVVWNAQHHWVNLAFALVHRHRNEAARGFAGALDMLLVQAAVFGPGIAAALVAGAARVRDALFDWTGVPAALFFTAFAFAHAVEPNWLLGPAFSLAALGAIWSSRPSPRARALWGAIAFAPAVAVLALAGAIVIAPGPAYAAAVRWAGLRLHGAGPFELYAFAPLARDVRGIAERGDAVVMTDGYGLSSVLDFDAGIPPVVVGYNWEGRESRRWYSSTNTPARALFVDKVPLATRPDIALQLHRACGAVVDGGERAYRFSGTPPRSFYFTWCDRPVGRAIAILRWQQPERPL